jgi:hypothetical protein
MAALAEKLTAALGQPMYAMNSPMVGEYYESFDLRGRTEARAIARRIEDDAWNRPNLTLQLNHSDAYYGGTVSYPSRFLLFVTAPPEQLDVVDEQRRAAALDFKRIERGPSRRPPNTPIHHKPR